MPKTHKKEPKVQHDKHWTTINYCQATFTHSVKPSKISHVDTRVVNDVIGKLEKKFGQESPLVTSQGKTIEYLGMSIDYTVKGNVKIDV